MSKVVDIPFDNNDMLNNINYSLLSVSELRYFVAQYVRHHGENTTTRRFLPHNFISFCFDLDNFVKKYSDILDLEGV